MMYHEFLETCGVTEADFSCIDYHMFIEPFYAESEDINDVNAKAQFAVWFARQRKAFDRLRDRTRAIAMAEKYIGERETKLHVRELDVNDKEEWLSKREAAIRETAGKLRGLLSV